MFVSKIRQARRDANLTQYEIAKPLGVSVMLLSLIERGQQPIDAETEQRVLLLIRRLARLNETHAAAKKALAAETRSAAVN